MLKLFRYLFLEQDNIATVLDYGPHGFVFEPIDLVDLLSMPVRELGYLI